MNLDVDIKVPGLDELLGKLAPRRLSAVMKNIGAFGQDQAREHFQRGVDPYRHRWAPLQESTLNAYVGDQIAGRRRRRSYGRRPLIRTSTLIGSLNAQLVEGGTAVSIGASAKYAVYHQGDESHPSKGIVPRRMFLPTPSKPLPKAWREGILDAVEAYLDVEGTP